MNNRFAFETGIGDGFAPRKVVVIFDVRDFLQARRVRHSLMNDEMVG